MITTASGYSVPHYKQQYIISISQSPTGLWEQVIQMMRYPDPYSDAIIYRFNYSGSAVSQVYVKVRMVATRA